MYNHFGDKDRTIQWLRKALAAGLTANQVDHGPPISIIYTQTPRFRLYYAALSSKGELRHLFKRWR